MSTKVKVTLAVMGTVFVMVILFFTATPAGRTTFNNWMHGVQKADDASNYETKKEVEDACRAMVTSYKSDIVTYEQYKDSEDKDEKSWANNAKIRANQTAIKYNEYVLKNSYVWEDNIPDDINFTLEVVE